MRSGFRFSTIALGAILVAGVSVPAQQLPKPPAFSSGTELVVVDFFVTDKSDKAVRGLTAKDFVVKEDGKERPIVAFEAFPGDAVAADGAAAAPAGGAPAAATASAPASASTVLLVDDGQL